MPTFPKVGLDALLTPENCAVLLIDHQPFSARQRQQPRAHDGINNVTALAKTAKAYGVRRSHHHQCETGGEIFKQIQAVISRSEAHRPQLHQLVETAGSSRP